MESVSTSNNCSQLPTFSSAWMWDEHSLLWIYSLIPHSVVMLMAFSFQKSFSLSWLNSGQRHKLIVLELGSHKLLTSSFGQIVDSIYSHSLKNSDPQNSKRGSPSTTWAPLVDTCLPVIWYTELRYWSQKKLYAEEFLRLTFTQSMTWMDLSWNVKSFSKFYNLH